MPVLARTFEVAGLSTILVTQMPFWAEKMGVPRTLAVEFPFGHVLGQPKNREMQIRVIRQALEVLESADEPGTIVHSQETWPVPQKEAYKAWQPEERAPIVQILAPRYREILRGRGSSGAGELGSKGEMKDPTKRFSARVENYVKYRPSYPREIIQLLEEACGLTAEALIADIGSGTGKLSELFLEYGCRVIGVEPNNEMRKGGEQQLSRYPNFTSQAGRAEATGLAEASVDFITAGQAFHWFDTEKTRLEFARILRLGGWVVLVWNSRRASRSPLMQAYDQLIDTYGTDSQKVSHSQFTDVVLAGFFAPGGFSLKTFDYTQVLDFEALKGRLLSSSHAPLESHPNHIPMLESLAEIFEDYQVNGNVTMEYDTEVYYGQLSGKDSG